MFEAELSLLAPDDAVEIREGVRNVCRDFNDRYWGECDEGQEFPWAFYLALAEGGWIGVALPVEYGGGGRGITEVFESSRRCPVGATVGMHEPVESDWNLLIKRKYSMVAVCRSG